MKVARITIIGALCLFFCTGTSLWAQDFSDNRDLYKIRAFRIAEPITIDGRLEEQTWTVAERADSFYRVLPIDTGQAIAQTEVMMAYDDEHFYMAIICYDPTDGARPAESLRRDFSFGKNDNFLAFIDTYNDQTNGFSFGVSAAGAQWDGLQANGGFVSLDWDCKWRSAVSNASDRWIAEFAIPFRSIRYQEGVKEWGINFSRLDLKTAEKSSWAPVPRQFQTASLAFTGTVVWDEPPPRLGTRFSLIPYVAGRSSRDLTTDDKASWSGDAGLDAKITLSTSLNVDVTINPDFSQVEVDRQVTNLDRFELFFPERRQFFLENSDLFASLGSESVRPFFSRRIGLTSPVQAGIRLSGKLDEDWRVGLMNMQTGSQDAIPAANFTVAALQRKVFDRSNISVFLVNKSLTGDYDPESDLKQNGVVGIEYNLASRDNRWTGKAFVHQAFEPGANNGAHALSADVTYSTQQWQVSLAQSRVGSDYRSETGFVRRNGFYRFQPEVRYRWFTETARIASHGPTAGLELFYNNAFERTDQIWSLGYNLQWRDRSSFTARLQNHFILLTAPFDPTNTGGETLPAGSDHSWYQATAVYTSNSRNIFNFEIGGIAGGYYHGDRYGMEATLNYRFQPYGSIGLFGAYNHIELPAPYADADLILVGPKLDLTFTNTIFFTTFVQYNNQIDNINVNMRFQWRYAPVSDFFIVYTNNSFPSPLQSKDRALVAKVSYYFN